MSTSVSTPSTGPDDPPVIHVAVGVIRQPDGRVLIARRPEGSHQGGRWEFPGGKVEPQECVTEALGRELLEEVGITPLESRPLLRVTWRYPDKTVLLDTWEVRRFSGTASGCEGQPVRWVAPVDLPRYRFPDANGPIITAASLPDTYLITPDLDDHEARGLVDELSRRFAAGARLVQLRLPRVNERTWHRVTADAADAAREYGVQLLLNGDVERARLLRVGVHLRSAQLLSWDHRPLGPGQLVAASCHHAAELDRAVHLGVDFALLGPVRPTRSHPDSEPMGERAFGCTVAQVPVPVYALGGVTPEDLPALREQRAQGIAAISGLWHAYEQA